jgi:hypothetical protein
MIFALLFFPLISFSHIIQDDVSSVERARFSFKYACSKMGFADSPLIDHQANQLDCMSRKFEVSDFCGKELAADPYYIRAYIDGEKQEVVCVSGKKVIFRYQCVKLSDRAMCSAEPKKACTHIHKKLAFRLSLIHSSFVTTEKGIKQLNCFFDSQ